MQSLIDDLLSYSRLTTQTKPFEEINLAQIVNEVISDLEVRIEKSLGKVETSALPFIEADPTQIRQLFQNLISNALKFHKPDEPPLVKIYSSDEIEGFKIITVEDNGIGIEEKYYDKIFGVFQRLHGKDKYEGSGIGLAVCKKIVEKHEGTIKIESKPGIGTKFIISLPIKHNIQENNPDIID